MDKETKIFIDVLFFYYIKRKYSENEFILHKNRFDNKNIHNFSFNKMNKEFANCAEAKQKKNSDYCDFLSLNKNDKNTFCRYIYFYLYCKYDIFYCDNIINKYYDYLIDNKLNLSDLTKLNFDNDEISEVCLTQNKPIYFINYNHHAGHVLSYFINFLSKHSNCKFAITNDFYNKNKHVIDMMKLLKENDLFIILDESNKNKFVFENLPSQFNTRSLFTTEDFLSVKNITFEEKMIDDIKYILSNSDKSTMTYFNNINFFDDCINMCCKKHENIETYKNIFLVKNNKRTPFNNTPARGFNIDNIDDITKKYNFLQIDPQNIEFSLLVYYLNNAENIITSWNTIMYINKFFFNKKAKVIVLCHKLYHEEYNYVKHKYNIYFADCDKLCYIQDLNTDSINENFVSKIIKLF